MKRDVTVDATETTFRILEMLKELDGAGVTELATRLDIPKSTVHNHLVTLRKNEYVVKHGTTYRVGLQFLEFGEHTRNRMKIYDIARPEVEGLAEETGELSNFLVEEHGLGAYLCRARGDRAVRVDTYAGMRVHLHCTGLGKAMLAHMPEARVSEILDRRGLEPRTETTITDRDTLYEALAAIRERGYAIDHGERLSGLRCVAAPITDDADNAVGAVSVSGPSSRMKGEQLEKDISELVMSAANVIELNMSHS
ncbi:IclR family transcriptional regulator [Halococcus salifodinae]|uniref:IclR family transcriptional regulator n=1 Tax=Halococcus salifodinae DSM 8989 TaxID=1227456 RepID=M0MS33_9EURY|nr:IclR family transcriptional regulator [Halococcus salifodinae]EMA48178.1 IclR family transcriptional regulator [Halococcus salifodinae DSM 8989]